METDENSSAKNFGFSKPAVYQIRIIGMLEERYSIRLGGMQIRTSKKPGKETISILTGRVNDQAALSGILNSLYEMHQLVLSVEMLGRSED